MYVLNGLNTLCWKVNIYKTFNSIQFNWNWKLNWKQNFYDYMYDFVWQKINACTSTGITRYVKILYSFGSEVT